MINWGLYTLLLYNLDKHITKVFERILIEFKKMCNNLLIFLFLSFLVNGLNYKFIFL